MKTAAIIAEYNPFHNGHAYQIEETRKLTGADYILVLMSGDFVQRGAPAIFNKYLRTRMALLGGADVVLELPLPYACSSAEFFAGGGITLLNQLNTVDYLSFGSECGDIDTLLYFAHILLNEPDSYLTALHSYLKQGLSFPAARYQALLQSCASYDEAIINSLFSAPNNILGLEYCKALLALDSPIQPVTIERMGSYHNDSLQEYSSATAIRKALLETNESICNHVPESVCSLLTACMEKEPPTCLDTDDFSLLLHYKLLSERNSGFADYLDCNQEISDKICKYLPDYTNFTCFCDLLKSKNLTYTRISRILLHILLDIKTPAFYKNTLAERELFVPYARLLGFKKEASPLLNQIKKCSTIPLLGNLADSGRVLSEPAGIMLQKEIFACHVYESVYAAKSGHTALNEYRQAPIVL